MDRTGAALTLDERVVNDHVEAKASAQRLNCLSTPEGRAGVDLRDPGFGVCRRDRVGLVVTNSIEARQGRIATAEKARTGRGTWLR